MDINLLKFKAFFNLNMYLLKLHLHRDIASSPSFPAFCRMRKKPKDKRTWEVEAPGVCAQHLPAM